MSGPSFLTQLQLWWDNGNQPPAVPVCDDSRQVLTTTFKPRRSILRRRQAKNTASIEDHSKTIVRWRPSSRKASLFGQVLSIYPIASNIARYLSKDEMHELYNQKGVRSVLSKFMPSEEHESLLRTLGKQTRECTVCFVGRDECESRERSRQQYDFDGWKRGVHTCLSCADVSCTSCTIFFCRRDPKAYRYRRYHRFRRERYTDLAYGQGYQTVHTYCRTCFLSKSKLSATQPRTLNLGLNAITSFMVGMHMPLYGQPMQYTTLVEGEEVPPAPKSDDGLSLSNAGAGSQGEEEDGEGDDEDLIVEAVGTTVISARFLPYFRPGRLSFVKYEGDLVPQEMFEYSASKCWMTTSPPANAKRPAQAVRLNTIPLVTI